MARFLTWLDMVSRPFVVGVLVMAGSAGFASASWGQGFTSPVGGNCANGQCPTYDWQYQIVPQYVSAPVAQPEKPASGKMTQAQFDAECEAYSAKHNGKVWWETCWEDGSGKILVEKGFDGKWHYTVIENDKKSGKAISITTQDGKKLEVKDLSGKAGIEETTDRDAKKPATDYALANGVVPSQKADKPTYVVNGNPVQRETVKGMLEDQSKKINDISTKPWVVAVGDIAQQKKAEDAITKMHRTEENYKGMTAEEVKDKGLRYQTAPDDVTVTITDPQGKVLHSQKGADGVSRALASGPISERRYDPKKDPDLRDGEGGFSLPSLDAILSGKAPIPGWAWAVAAGAGVWWYRNNQDKKKAAATPK